MVKWILESSTDEEYIYARARELGWLEKPQKVQVKKIRGMDTWWYEIEPFEIDCHCPQLVQPF